VRIEEARAAAGDGSAAAAILARRERLAGELAALEATREALSALAELRALVPDRGATSRDGIRP
jgi:hypothetical protein